MYPSIHTLTDRANSGPSFGPRRRTRGHQKDPIRGSDSCSRRPATASKLIIPSTPVPPRRGRTNSIGTPPDLIEYLQSVGSTTSASPLDRQETAAYFKVPGL